MNRTRRLQELVSEGAAILIQKTPLGEMHVSIRKGGTHVRAIDPQLGKALETAIETLREGESR